MAYILLNQQILPGVYNYEQLRILPITLQQKKIRKEETLSITATMFLKDLSLNHCLKITNDGDDLILGEKLLHRCGPP